MSRWCSSSHLKGFCPRLAEDFLEGTSEVSVKDGVNSRVKGAVTVANPEEEFKQGVGDLTGLPAHTAQAVTEEKGEPAHYKHPHDHRQDKCKPLLSGLRDLFPGKGAPAALPPGGEEVHGFVADPGDATALFADFLLAGPLGFQGVLLLLGLVTFAL